MNFFRPYFHYCSSSAHYCEDRFHIQDVLCQQKFNVLACETKSRPAVFPLETKAQLQLITQENNVLRVRLYLLIA